MRDPNFARSGPVFRLPAVRRALPRLALVVAVALLAVTACGDSPVGPRAEDFEDEPAPTPQPEVVAFVGVNVVPMDTDRVLRDHTVIVRGTTIETVGPTSSTEVPAGAFRIEGRGRYLIPGLGDMHVHLTSGTFEHLRNDFVSWLANGVTTLRVMWGSLGVLAERDRIEAGEITGPALLVASPGIDGPGGPWEQFTPSVASSDEARERARQHIDQGYDFLKVYNDLDDPSYMAIVDEADQAGIDVIGHIPSRVGIHSAQDAGQRTSEHFIGMRRQGSTPFRGGTLDRARLAELAARSAESGMVHTPTVSVDALSRSRVRDIARSAEIEFISPGMRSFFEDQFFHGFEDGEAEREARNHREMIGIVHDAGAGLLVGTDAGFGWVLPGWSIHGELRAFVEAGLSPWETLRIATAGAADVTGRAGEFGRVEEGMRADLVLLARDPLSDIDAVREISGTMVRGRWLSRGTMLDMLEQIREEYRSGPQAAAATPGLTPSRLP